MVKQITGQSIKTEPYRLGFTDDLFYETKASIIERLCCGKSKAFSKLDMLKQSGLSVADVTGGSMVGGSMVGGGMDRLVQPFQGGKHSQFLNFTSGRSTKGATAERRTDPAQGRAIVKGHVAFNRF